MTVRWGASPMTVVWGANPMTILLLACHKLVEYTQQRDHDGVDQALGRLVAEPSTGACSERGGS